ncbi:MAG: hypothetical protein ACRECA_06990, partial [Pseudolabrys sp.]
MDLSKLKEFMMVAPSMRRESDNRPETGGGNNVMRAPGQIRATMAAGLWSRYAMQFVCDAPGRKAWFRIET